MRLSRRQALAGALALPALAACGRRDPVGTLRFWAMGNEAAHVPKLVPAFESAHAGISLSIQALPWTAAHEKLLTGFAGSSLPAVSQIGNSWLAELAAIGAIEPLPEDQSALTTDQFPAVLDTNRIGGKVYGVPWYVDTRLQFYRTDLLAEAGYDAPPETWPAWKAMLHKVKAAAGEGNFAILLPVNEFEQLLTFALQQPEPLLREGGARGNFRSDGFKAALAFYKSLFDERLAPLAANTQISNVWNEFARGFFSVYLSGPWTVGDMKSRLPADFQDQWATAAMPGPDGPGASAPGGSSLVVFKGARDPAAAWAWVRYLSQPPVQARFNALSGDLPARPSAWELAGLRADPLMRPFAEQLERAKAVPKVPEWERIVTEMQVVAERCVRGQFTVDQAAAEIDRRADRLLEKRRWMLEQGRAL
ncbi:extracellular solute-binding protein [Sphingomonas gilva]|uniref:Extracellular solute-binding protein n=1 Tax=Sphingomonas gilva TaxID=2305907 RepID=A0A396RXZ1_9SPHN|nr:sugar ABC transporter substrate-binding protein [Sphingomonas gilva]RHW18591.1 extracellular solute-binding protein [Sphingomonas gilva]